MKLSFKKQERSIGLAHVADPIQAVDIKLDNKIVGFISPPNLSAHRRIEEYWRIHIRVAEIETSDNPSGFAWITFKAKFNTENEAREWLKEKIDDIVKLYPIHFNTTKDNKKGE